MTTMKSVQTAGPGTIEVAEIERLQTALAVGTDAVFDSSN